MTEYPAMPPHVVRIALYPTRVVINFSPGFDPEIPRALGGRQRSTDFGGWEFDAPSDKAAGVVLEALRDRGVIFHWLEGGWPPAAVFEELRDRGLVTGKVRALVIYGPAKWKLRDV